MPATLSRSDAGGSKPPLSFGRDAVRELPDPRGQRSALTLPHCFEAFSSMYLITSPTV